MKISDLFYSLQGEGANVGLATIFIRFFDCNLTCSFCDETKHKLVQFEAEISEILAKLEEFPAKRVCLTGGEPSLEDRKELISALQSKGFYVTVETNGFKPENIKNADWITYSPKDFNDITFGDWFSEIKILVQESTPDETLEKIISQVQVPCFLQPIQVKKKEQNLKNVYKATSFILSHPQIRLSLQLQTWIHIQ
ncbi:MAG: 7-carboxy-7-deazaguanine synthase QueE [SAR324 cluster bacterium]|nr:7-carboxy-7-deazaguanine synthase QueE [SAR324 cluster bacterium]